MADCLCCPAEPECRYRTRPAVSQGGIVLDTGTVTQRRRAALGQHPVGPAALAREGHPGHGRTCGECRHLSRHQFSKTYLGCDLTRKTGGPATDTRSRWPACEKWEAPDAP